MFSCEWLHPSDQSKETDSNCYAKAKNNWTLNNLFKKLQTAVNMTFFYIFLFCCYNKKSLLKTWIPCKAYIHNSTLNTAMEHNKKKLI